MPALHDELAPAILAILKAAARGTGEAPHFLTAYQILQRLPDELRTKLIDEHGTPGRGAGKHHTSVSRVALVAREIAYVDYMDASGVAFEFHEGDLEQVAAGNRVIGLYRAHR